MTELRQNADGSASFLREKDSAEVGRLGSYAGAAGSNAPSFEHSVYLHFNLATTSGAGGALAWQNTLNDDIIVTKAVLDVTTASAGAGTLHVGSATGSAVTASNIISAQSVNATATVTPSTPISVKVTKNNYVTATQASGSLSGTVASLYLTYIRGAQAGAA